MAISIGHENRKPRHSKGIDTRDRSFMKMAFELAVEALELGEAPVGAVFVKDGHVIGSGFNRIETDNDPTAHAEILALREATKKIGDWRLSGATIYVTLEPCMMCAAALLHARVDRVVFGAYDNRWGGLGSLFDLAHDPRINHELEVVPEVMKKECSELLTSFFRRLRNQRPKNR
ncbi:tRNA adenosine(34) deaminase TadA [Thermodesulfobacteriota bacterium]